MKEIQNIYNLVIGNLIILILMAATVTLIMMYNNLSSTVQTMSKVMIQDRLDLTKKEVHNIFESLNKNLQTARSQGKKGLFGNLLSHQKINAIFIPLLKNTSSISSLTIANSDGDEYMLLKNDSVWITRKTIKGSKYTLPVEYYWNEDIHGKEILIDKKEHLKPYDPRLRPWYKLSFENKNDSSIQWTSPYTFFTSQQPGITATTKWFDRMSNKYYVIGMDVLIADLSEFTTTIDVTDNGKVFILSDKFEVIGLPKDKRFLDNNAIKEYTLKKLIDLDIPVLNTAIDAYYKRNTDRGIFSFEFESQRWWAGIQDYYLSPTNKLSIGVVVPETDFSGEIADTRRLLIGGFVMIFLFFLIILFSFFQLKKANKIIAMEKDKNEQLLLNTLPVKVVNDLKENGKSEPQKFKNVTVYFSDLVGFTDISASLDPKELINELNDIYTSFDEIMIKYGCERIKTIGDAYLAVCGMPEKNPKHAEMMLMASLDVMKYIEDRSEKSQLKWKMRIGLHSGNVVGGIVGIKKYIYDVFGDTINTASRMENNSIPMKVNISEDTYQNVKNSAFIKENNIVFENREAVEVKGKGSMNMYFVSQISDRT